MQTIEAEIIPRLLLAHRQVTDAGQAGSSYSPGGGTDQVGRHEVVEFSRVLIEHDADVAAQFVELFTARGVSDESILFELFAPAARELGEMWLRDDCSFAEVTIGLCTLEQLLMRVVAQEELGPEVEDVERVILLSAMPGEQHVFGLLMVKQLFRRAGWAVVDLAASVVDDLTTDDLVEAVEQRWITIAGLSVGCEEALSDCAALIRELRRASRNPNIAIMVGGRLFQDGSEKHSFLAADMIASDGRDAIAQAESLVERLALRSAYH